MRYGFLWIGVTYVAFGVFMDRPLWAATPQVVINELYYHSEPACAPYEYIELLNASDEPVRLAGWFLAEGIRFTFPNDANLGPGEFCVIAEDPQALREAFPDIPARIYGPYQGNLSNSGERIELLDRNRRTIDELTYSDRAPWPALADGLGASLELIHPSLREYGPAAWRASRGATLRNSNPVRRFDVTQVTATPGRPNSVYQDSPPPLVEWPHTQPSAPRGGEEVAIETRVHFADPEAVTLLYQVVAPGAYIQLNSPDYSRQWTRIAMQPLGDDRYAAIIPGQPHRSLVRYIIHASNSDGETYLPDATEPSPNLAYFVYDGVPPYRVQIPEERVHTELEKVPVYHLIANAEDVRQCLEIRLTDRIQRREFRWYATFVHEGRVYDHVRFRLRGGVWRYQFNKRMWKIRFNKGDYFEGYHNDGTPYATPRRTLNLNSITQNMQVHNPKRGELGLFETAGFWLFRMAGVSSPHTDWAHFRIIQRENEEGRDQFSGDFMGLYLSIEQMDERFLEAHNIPDGSALYKMNRGWTVDGNIWEKETNQCDPAGEADIEHFYNGYNRLRLPFLERALDID